MVLETMRVAIDSLPLGRGSSLVSDPDGRLVGVRSERDMERVRQLLAEGLSTRQVAAITRVPFSTVARWRGGDTAAFGAPPIVVKRPWRPADAFSYAYLLGMYLGDGCLSQARKSVLLRISLDSSYPAIVEECRGAVLLSMPSRRVGVYPDRRHNATYVQSTAARWLEAFPQHGPGRKHERAIVLEPWQREVVDRFPQQFLRGLIHSDGCRTINRFKTKLPSGRVAEYEYPRYFFSNCRPTSAGCSASTATGSGSGGRCRTRATCRCRTARASRCSTSSWGRRARRPCAAARGARGGAWR